MIRYDRLWDTMANRGMTQYKLIKFHGFSAGQIGRLKKNMHVSTHTLETLCRLLDCRIEDIVEYAADGSVTAPALEDIPAVRTVSPTDQTPAADSGAPASPDESEPQIQPSISDSSTSSKAEKTKKGSKTKKASKKSLKNAKKSRKK